MSLGLSHEEAADFGVKLRRWRLARANAQTTKVGGETGQSAAADYERRARDELLTFLDDPGIDNAFEQTFLAIAALSRDLEEARECEGLADAALSSLKREVLACIDPVRGVVDIDAAVAMAKRLSSAGDEVSRG